MKPYTQTNACDTNRKDKDMKEALTKANTEKRLLLKFIEGYKKVIDKIINSDSYPLSDDLVGLSMEMERKLQEIKKG